MRPVKKAWFSPFPAKKKNARVLNKEVALLGEEDWEAREVDDLIVYFRLTKVGIDCELSGQWRRDAKLCDFDSYIAAHTTI